MLLQVMTNGHTIIGGLTWEHILIGLGLSAVCAVGLYLPYWKPKGQVIECQAVVKSKRVEYSNTPHIYYRGQRFNYVVTFIDENGREVELTTIEANYGNFKEGDRGRLKYQRETIIEFERVL